MAGLPWIKVAVEVGGHPKLEHFERLLGLEDGLGVIVRMWCWAASYCPTGFIPDERVGPMERHIVKELTITYGGVPGMFTTGGPPGEGECIKALAESGWIERVTLPVTQGVTHGPGYLIHEWDDMQSAHSDRAKEKNRERQRRFREKHQTRNVTHNVTVTAPDVEEKREEKKKHSDRIECAPGEVLSTAGPTTTERVRLAVSQGLGVVGPGGGGLPLPSSRRLGQVIRDTNAAVELRGFEPVVEALVATGQAAKQQGTTPETFGFFGGTLHGLASADPAPLANGHARVTAPASPPAVFVKGGPVAL